MVSIVSVADLQLIREIEVPQSEEEKLNNNKVWWITIAWIAFWAVVVMAKWSDAKQMELNAWGDFFAGVFAPLAFLWLIVGYYQQAKELGQNTEAILLQVKELNNSVEQQKQLAEVAAKELELSKRQAKTFYEKEKSSAQPWIRFLGGEQELTSSGMMYELELKNVGAEVRSVDFFIEHMKSEVDDFVIAGDSQELNLWQRDQTVWISFFSQSRKSLNEGDLCSFKVSFIDSLKEQGELYVYTIFDDDKFIPIQRREYEDLLAED